MSLMASSTSVSVIAAICSVRARPVAFLVAFPRTRCPSTNMFPRSVARLRTRPYRRQNRLPIRILLWRFSVTLTGSSKVVPQSSKLSFPFPHTAMLCPSAAVAVSSISSNDPLIFSRQDRSTHIGLSPVSRGTHTSSLPARTCTMTSSSMFVRPPSHWHTVSCATDAGAWPAVIPACREGHWPRPFPVSFPRHLHPIVRPVPALLGARTGQVAFEATVVACGCSEIVFHVADRLRGSFVGQWREPTLLSLASLVEDTNTF